MGQPVKGWHNGQAIGSSGKDGDHPYDCPVTLGDIAATIYHHFGVPLDATYEDHRGRPRYIVEDGKPLGELI
jgi:hypothetical protein